jgi:hypothetical protein
VNWHLGQDEAATHVVLEWREKGVSMPDVSAVLRR